MSRGKYSPQEMYCIIDEIESGEISVKAAISKYGLSKPTLRKWRCRYEASGSEGFTNRTHNNSYSAELKLQAVQDYLYRGLSQPQILVKYKIASRNQLSGWIKKYNDHSSLKAYNGGAKAMTKGRATTFQERIDIVHYCLSQQHDYQKTADQYKVSYQQIYQWVKKYEAGGQDALQDRRGRSKTAEELTDADRQKLAMKKLEYENERLRAENAFLKKLEELERRPR